MGVDMSKKMDNESITKARIAKNHFQLRYLEMKNKIKNRNGKKLIPPKIKVVKFMEFVLILKKN